MNGEPGHAAEPAGSGHSVHNDERVPFHAQLHAGSSHADHASLGQHVDLHGKESHAFAMDQMVNALPPMGDRMRDDRRPSLQYNTMPGIAGLNPSANMQYMQHMSQYSPQRTDFHFVSQASPVQHQYPNEQYGQHIGHYQQGARPFTAQVQTQFPFGRVEPYQYAMSQGYSPVDARFAQMPPSGYGMPGNYADMSHYSRSRHEAPAVPTFPRGPPRKPKQSGHALWVGNLPPAARIIDLKDHFSREARSDILSLFLISKSNCAFVNYRSAAACAAAMNRFHDSRFINVRLVCRLRRGSSTTDVSPASNSVTDNSKPLVDGVPDGEASMPTIVDGTPSPAKEKGQASESPATASTKVPEKFFIMKSLTTQDLEASARNGVWATQSHNEPALNRAFNEAENVYLIFSANKSGEYFGYARMESAISGDPMPNESSATSQNPRSPMASDTPRTIPTPATATAPRGRIVDDSGRGTIFWEAELTDDEEDEDVTENAGNSEMGRPFNIAWVSTRRLPFHNTRSLRNPWNSDREIKIARDGTEIEPSVAQRLIQHWHRQPPVSVAPGVMPYQMMLPN